MSARDRREDPGQYYPGGSIIQKTPTPSGGGGTSDYSQLANKPQINGHELIGNKTAADLGLATPGDIPNVSGKLPVKPLPKYLHVLSFDDTYNSDAEAWYASLSPDAMGGACSAVRRGGFLYRNYDWTFDSAAEFVVRMSAAEGRHASVGVASLGASLAEDEVASGVYTAKYRALPGMTLDGINDAGVVAEINVDGGPKTGWHGTGANALHILAAVRWVLDHGETAAQAAEYIAANVKQPTGDLNFHFMIADGTYTYIVENGESHLIDAAEAKVLTNYALYDEVHAGGGKERYTLLAGGAAIEAAHWTNAYAEGNDWDSDFDSAAAHASAITQWAEQGETKEAHRGKTTAGGSPWWQSVHTSVYDFAAKTLKVAVQESDEYFTFAVGGANVELDDTVTHDSANGVKSSGIWSAIWGALAALPTGFSSLYDWCAAQLAALQSGKRDLTDRSFEITEEYENWTPGNTPIPENPQVGSFYYGQVAFGSLIWTCVRLDWAGPGIGWIPGSLIQMSGDYTNPNATELTFPDGTKTYKKRTFEDMLALESQLAGKVDKVSGKGLSQNDYTDADKAEVAKVKYKADEFTEWDLSGLAAFGIYDGVLEFHPAAEYQVGDWTLTYTNDGVRHVAYKEFSRSYVTILTDFEEDAKPTLVGFTATRRRVLRTGDAPATSDIIDPALAAAVGKIADAKLTRDFVNTMVSTNSAHYLTARAGTAGAYTYPPFASASALRAALAAHTEQNPQFFYAGEAFTPTKNDWVIVSEDEDHPLGTITPASRYGFVGTFGSGGSFQYQVSYKLPLTTAQIAALDSEITKALVTWLTAFKGTDTATTLASILAKLAHLESDGTADDTFATYLLGKTVAISAMHYALGTAITASAKLADRTTNFVNALSTLTDPIDLTFPDLMTGKCRDFLVRVHRETGGVAVSFTAPTGAVVYGDGFSTAIGENEDWLFAITETAANEWYVRAIKLEVAA